MLERAEGNYREGKTDRTITASPKTKQTVWEKLQRRDDAPENQVAWTTKEPELKGSNNRTANGNRSRTKSAEKSQKTKRGEMKKKRATRKGGKATMHPNSGA